MARVTVLKRGRFVAQAEISVSGTSAAAIEAAGRAVCEDQRKSFPTPATVRVEEFSGRWQKVAEVVVA